MISVESIIAVAALIWVTVYTVSYGTWNWKKKNRLAAVAIYIVAAAALILPLYAVFIREG